MKNRFLVPKNPLPDCSLPPQLDLITDLLGTPPLSALSSACEGARAHILMGPHKPVSMWPQLQVVGLIQSNIIVPE